MTFPFVIAEFSGTILLIAMVILLLMLRKQISARGALERQVEELSRLAELRQTDLLRVYQEAPVSIVIRKGPELRIEFINEAALQQNRLSRQAVEGTTTSDYFRKVQTNFNENTLRDVYRTGEPFKAKAYPLRFDRNGDGQLAEAWYDIVICPTRDTRGQIDGVATYTFDVTELVDANERLSASDQRFRFIADAIPHKLWTSGPDGRATYYNRGWYDYTGTSNLEELRAVVWQLIHPDDLAETTRLWQQAIEKGTDIEIEQRLRRHDGEYRWHLSRVCVFKNEGGEVLMWIGTSTNIHEYKTATTALAASEQHFKMLANSNSLLIWQTNKEGETIFVNDTWRAYTGITALETGLSDWMDNHSPRRPRTGNR